MALMFYVLMNYRKEIKTNQSKNDLIGKGEGLLNPLNLDFWVSAVKLSVHYDWLLCPQYLGLGAPVMKLSIHYDWLLCPQYLGLGAPCCEDVHTLWLTAVSTVPGFWSPHTEQPGQTSCLGSRPAQPGRQQRHGLGQRRERRPAAPGGGAGPHRVWPDPRVLRPPARGGALPQPDWVHAGEDPDGAPQCLGAPVPGAAQHGQGACSPMPFWILDSLYSVFCLLAGWVWSYPEFGALLCRCPWVDCWPFCWVQSMVWSLIRLLGLIHSLIINPLAGFDPQFDH